MPGIGPHTQVNYPMSFSPFRSGAAVAVLLAANAFFVAAEFALVASRRTRIEEIVRHGDRKAKTVQAALQDLYRKLATAWLGITFSEATSRWIVPPLIEMEGRRVERVKLVKREANPSET